MADFAKKLTVSFGAFSCTLSGFDDPFPVMRQVVDYFQQLATSDPSFGAHPERPDTDALKALAEETSGLRVDAEIVEDEVILRSAEDTPDSSIPVVAKTLDEPNFPMFEDMPEPHDEPIEPEEVVQGDVDQPLPQLSLDDLDEKVFENLDPDELYENVEENASEESADSNLGETNDPLTVWTTEFEEEEPIEAAEMAAQPEEGSTETEQDQTKPTYEDHVEAEQRALEKILEATRNSAATEPTEAVFEQVSPALEEEAPKANPAISSKETTEQPLVLGFGDKDAENLPSVSINEEFWGQSQPSQTELLESMGVQDEYTEEFSWDEEEVTEAESEPAEAAPLLLSLSNKVSPEPVVEESEIAPSPAIDMQKDDPRTDLRRFAASAGAVSMTELLEASAAYATLVNGRPSFSRMEVLDLLDNFSDDEGFSQEARIKTFGSLLRGGRIQPVENGEYEMSDDALSEYEERRAG